MARKRIKLLYPLQTVLTRKIQKIKCPTVLQILLSLVFIFWFDLGSWASDASVLTEKGHEQLQRGEAKKALKTWSEAYKIYRSSSNFDGATGSLINQSLALQALGLYSHACQTLIEGLKVNENWICSGQEIVIGQDKKLNRILDDIELNKIQLIGLQNLGNVLRLMGKGETSEILLKKILSRGSFGGELLYVKNNILLNLGDTEKFLCSQALEKYQLIEEPLAKGKALDLAKSKFQSALNFYQQLDTNNNNLSIKLLAALNQVDLLLKSEEFNLSDRESNIQSLSSLTKQLLTANLKQLPTIESLKAQIKFSEILIQIYSNEKFNHVLGRLELEASLFDLASTLEKAQINNQKTKSLTKGTSGKIYHHLGKTEDSKANLEKALILAQSIQAWDITYKWQQELGRVYRKTGEIDRAEKMYISALANVEEIQNDILSTNSPIKFSFKDEIEPLYQEYLELLLSVAQPNFEKAIQVKEDLQLAELKNFLQCSNLPLFQIEINENKTSIEPIIYIFKFKNRVDIIVKIKNQIVVHKTQDLSEVIYSIDNLINIVRAPDFFAFPEENFLTASQNLYDLLFAPIKEYLPKDGSLRFVLDTYFQSIPFALIHDSENYLIEKYNISMSLTSKFLEPVFLKPEDLNVFFAGISQLNPNLKTFNTSRGYTPLPEVKTELLNIKLSANNTLELMNKNFTSRKFQELATKTDFPTIHISSHGQFSSDPKKTFILAWDKPINVRELEYLVRIHEQKNSNPIDLLVLSACETAKGDKRSALGIAGVAVMAGARTTLASLWLVDSQSTTQLMGDFYKGLKKGLNESQALREAQLALSKNPKYSHPYYWAPFILVGR